MPENILNVDVGDVARVTARFTHPDNAYAVDPDNVLFRWTAPDGTKTTFVYGTDNEVSRVDAGVYRCHIDCAQNGRYHVRCWSTGLGQAAEIGAITVRQDPTARN